MPQTTHESTETPGTTREAEGIVNELGAIIDSAREGGAAIEWDGKSLDTLEVNGKRGQEALDVLRAAGYDI